MYDEWIDRSMGGCDYLMDGCSGGWVGGWRDDGRVDGRIYELAD